MEYGLRRDRSKAGKKGVKMLMGSCQTAHQPYKKQGRQIICA